MKRVLSIDGLTCPRCSSRTRRVPMVVLAFLTDPGVVRRILAHRKLPTVAPAVARARSSASPFGFELTEEGSGSSSA